MNAIEFVKEHGIEYTTGIVVGCESGFLPKNDNYFDLKKIIDAFELVESKGGLVECKKILSRDNFTWCSGGSVYGNPLKRAVNLVEQCQ